MGPQLIYSFSTHNERPGVWMPVILVSLSLYQPIVEELCCKDGLLAHLGLNWITFAYKKNYWCYQVLSPCWSVICFLVLVTTLVLSIVLPETLNSNLLASRNPEFSKCRSTHKILPRDFQRIE